MQTVNALELCNDCEFRKAIPGPAGLCGPCLHEALAQMPDFPPVIPAPPRAIVKEY